MNKVKTQGNGLKAGGYVTAVRTVYEHYKACTQAHYKDEEAICLPLMREFFEPDKVGKKVADVMTDFDLLVLGMFVHGSKAGFKQFMTQEVIPSYLYIYALSWSREFKGKRVLYQKEMETIVQAILQGHPAEKAYTSKATLPFAMNCGEFSRQGSIAYNKPYRPKPRDPTQTQGLNPNPETQTQRPDSKPGEPNQPQRSKPRDPTQTQRPHTRPKPRDPTQTQRPKPTP
jgi:hypothetical protein